jgi:chromosome segregation ATPase
VEEQAHKAEEAHRALEAEKEKEAARKKEEEKSRAELQAALKHAQQQISEMKRLEEKQEEETAAHAREKKVLLEKLAALEAVKETIFASLKTEREAAAAGRRASEEAQKRADEEDRRAHALQKELNEASQKIKEGEAAREKMMDDFRLHDNAWRKKYEDSTRSREELSRAIEAERLRAHRLEEEIRKLKEKNNAAGEPRVFTPPLPNESRKPLSSREEIQRLELILELEDRKKEDKDRTGKNSA